MARNFSTPLPLICRPAAESVLPFPTNLGNTSAWPGFQMWHAWITRLPPLETTPTSPILGSLRLISEL